VDYIELKEAKAQQWLKTYQFYFRKIEDNSMENNRLAKDLHDNIRKLKKGK